MPELKKSYFALLAFLLVLTSCGTTHYALQHKLPVGKVAEIEVLGDMPRIQVDNLGPGRMRVQFLGRIEEIETRSLPVLGATQQTLVGPVIVRITALEKGGCEFELVAYDSLGLYADLRPRPDRAETP